MLDQFGRNVGERLMPVEFATRRGDTHELFLDHVYNGVRDDLWSKAIECFSWRNFTLYLEVDSQGVGTQEICFYPQFCVVRLGAWHDYVQGLFASLCYEDTDTINNLWEVFSGACAGQYFRLRVDPANVDTTDYFTVSAWVNFWT